MPILIFLFLTILAFLLLFVIIALLMLASDLFLDLPFVGTDKKKIKTIIELSQIKKGQTVVDLGSGDGRLLIAAAKAGANAVGYELNPLLIILTLIHVKLEGLSQNIKVYKKSFWQSDLAVADVIFVYAFKKSMQKFEYFVYQNAKKGTRIIVNTNPFPSKQPVKSENGIFLYQV